MVTPAVSNGIPTAELFAEDFFDGETRKTLEACYAGTLRRIPEEGDPVYNKGEPPFPFLYRRPGWESKRANRCG